MIYGEFKVIEPTYLITDNDGEIYYIPGKRVEVDVEHGIVLFFSGESAEAMFRLEDVKCYWRVE